MTPARREKIVYDLTESRVLYLVPVVGEFLAHEGFSFEALAEVPSFRLAQGQFASPPPGRTYDSSQVTGVFPLQPTGDLMPSCTFCQEFHVNRAAFARPRKPSPENDGTGHDVTAPESLSMTLRIASSFPV